MKSTLTLIFLLSMGWVVQAQKMSEKEVSTIRRSLSFESSSAPLLILHNVEGNVSIEGYDGSTVEVEARQVLSAKNERYLQQAKDEVKLVSRVEGDIILLYPETPDVKAALKDRQLSYSINRQDEDYRFHYDFVVRIPREISLQASTINDGEVHIRNISGSDIKLSNINGAIRAESVNGLTSVSTINGAIKVDYAGQPGQEARFKTINGEITVHLPEDLKADVRFRSMNGELFTNYEDVTIGPSVEEASSGKGPKKTYRLDKSTKVRINGGGPLLDFEVLNGNVYVKKY
jgi:DUF4097 and DUF4098 domain-containing protein YvlB